jgi:hypothetical protein
MMAALAHSLDDEPRDDPAEAEMPAADFEAIERAHEICGHKPAREVTAEFDEQRESQNCESPTLTRIAIRILSSQIRAAELVAEMRARGEMSKSNKLLNLEFETVSNLDKSPKLVDLNKLSDFGADEVDDPPATDWIAADAWNAKGWKDAAVEYRKRGNSSARMRR